MNKFYTSKEQSQKLTELGIDVNTADMCYGIDDDTLQFDELPWLTPYHTYTFKAHYIPCWSLSALLDILPKSEDKAFDVSYGHYDNDTYIPKWYIGYMDNSNNIPFIKMIDGDNLIDIVVQLLIYLKANEQI